MLKLMLQQLLKLQAFMFSFCCCKLVVTPNRDGVRERFEIEDLIIL